MAVSGLLMFSMLPSADWIKCLKKYVELEQLLKTWTWKITALKIIVFLKKSTSKSTFGLSNLTSCNAKSQLVERHFGFTCLFTYLLYFENSLESPESSVGRNLGALQGHALLNFVRKILNLPTIIILTGAILKNTP